MTTDWIEQKMKEVAEAAHLIADGYWAENRRKRGTVEAGRLGVRVRERQGGVAIEWYENKWIGSRNKKLVRSKYIKKGSC